MDINQIEELYNNYNIDIVKDIKRLENFIVLDKQKKQILYNQYKQQKKENEIIEYEKQLKKDQEKRMGSASTQASQAQALLHSNTKT